MNFPKIMILLCCVLALPLAAEEKEVLPTNFSTQEKEWVLRGLSPAVVTETLSRYANEFADGVNGRPLSPTAAMLSLAQLDQWIKYRYFECDTVYGRGWMQSLRKYFTTLIDARKKLRSLEQNGKTATKEYKQWNTYYQTTAKQLQAIVKKPQKPREKNVKDKDKELSLQKLRREKAKVVELLKKGEEKVPVKP